MLNPIAIKALVEKYQPKKSKNTGEILETYCNFFINDVSELWGCYDLDGMTANEIVQHCRKNWKVVDASEAVRLANDGCLVIAGWEAPEATPGGSREHGHVCLILSGELTYSSKHKHKVPGSCANVGKDNFYGKPISYAFGPDKEIEYFLYDN
jgi:hypothetical protein